MGVDFFGRPDGTGSRVWSASGGANDQDHDRLLARVRELESLCTEVLVAGVDLGLPQRLLNRLWGAVGHGELPHAFVVDLPSVLESPAIAPSELKPLSVKKTVAVVDDDPMMLDVLTRILRGENFELLMASGGREMMEKLQGHAGAVDLLITDYMMPAMQGRELAEHVRQRYPAVKVLYQTGFSDRLFENRAELDEGEAFLEKPFTSRGLREAARLVLFGAINP